MGAISPKLLSLRGVVVLVAACATSTPPAQAPSSSEPAGEAASDSAVTSAREESEEDFARAEAEIAQLFGRAEKAPAQGADARPLSAAERCERACRAVGTMWRAAERVCNLEPDGDWCGRVRHRAQRARERVAVWCQSCW